MMCSIMGSSAVLAALLFLIAYPAMVERQFAGGVGPGVAEEPEEICTPATMDQIIEEAAKLDGELAGGKVFRRYAQAFPKSMPRRRHIDFGSITDNPRQLMLLRIAAAEIHQR